MSKSNIIIGLIAVVALVFSVMGLSSNGNLLAGVSHISGPLDSVAGYYVNGTEFADSGRNISVGTVTATGESNLDTLVQGGDVVWVYGTTTLTAAQVCDSSVINIGLAADPVMTLTLPTSTDIIADCLPSAGDHKSLLIRDAATSTLAATIVAGSNIDLESDDANGDVLAAGASVELELYAATSTDGLVGILRPFTDAD